MLSDKRPLISIVLPTFNGSRYIATSIESILNQTYPFIELIIVDGGSKDNTIEIVKSISDQRITIISQTDNSGRLPGALNLGFKNASGSYFTWAQDDDIFSPNAIETMLLYLEEHSDVGLVYTGFWEIDDNGLVTGESLMGPPEDITIFNPVGHCFLYRREIAEKVGEYNVDYLMAEDAHYWMRIYQVSKIALIPIRFYFHRLHSNSLTVKNYGRYWARRVAAKARLEILGTGWFFYQKQIAETYIEEAFSAFSNGDLSHVRNSLAKGLWRNPKWLMNRGVVSILVQSLLRRGFLEENRSQV